MSAVLSISGRRCYGLARVCRVWGIPRAGIYRQRRTANLPETPRRRPGPQGPMPYAALVDEIRTILTAIDQIFAHMRTKKRLTYRIFGQN